MFLNLVGSVAFLTLALAIPASVEYSARAGVQYAVTDACAQDDPDEDLEACNCATKPNTYCCNKVNKRKAW